MYKSMPHTRPNRWTMAMDRDEYLQRYTQLSRQSEALRQRLSTCSALSEGPSPTDSLSPSVSPARRRSSIQAQAQPFSFPSTQAWPTPLAVSGDWKSSGSEQVDEANLYEINHQIKCLLTDLLNCDSVKADKPYRAWVQARLMEAEHELKRQRRRKSSAAQETMRSISLSHALSPIPGCRASY